MRKFYVSITFFHLPSVQFWILLWNYIFKRAVYLEEVGEKWKKKNIFFSSLIIWRIHIRYSSWYLSDETSTVTILLSLLSYRRLHICFPFRRREGSGKTRFIFPLMCSTETSEEFIIVSGSYEILYDAASTRTSVFSILSRRWGKSSENEWFFHSTRAS